MRNVGTKADARGFFKAFRPRRDAGAGEARLGTLLPVKRASKARQMGVLGEESEYPPNWPEISLAVKKRDGYKCQVHKLVPGIFCSRRRPCLLHVHHIIPVSCGGSHHPSNLLTLCFRCHWVFGHDRNPDGSYKKKGRR